MNSQEQKRIKVLVELLNQYNYNYHQLSKSEISDYQFDMMMKELEELEKKHPQYISKNSPTQKVGGSIIKSFNTVFHKTKMLSLSNSYNENEIKEFDNKIKKTTNHKFSYACDLKYDGVAISLIYRNGELDQAITRGDGIKGDDITSNVKTISSIPIKLNEELNYLEVRGEIFMHKSNFLKLNAHREKLGLNKFANPRNTVSGTLKMQDPREVAQRKLNIFIYSINELTPIKKDINTQYKAMKYLNKLGFNTPIRYKNFFKICHQSNEILDFTEYWNTYRSDLDFEIDGIVIKVNELDLHNQIGETAKSPKWAIAYKFKAEEVITQINSVSFQVGRTGVITPVANLSPVLLGGTIVKRASLHNQDLIEKLNLHLKDYVKVEKGGEIIPKIVGVHKSKNDNEVNKIKFPETCPACDSVLVKKSEAHHFCLNSKRCKPQIIGKIIHFSSREAMDINFLGEETINLLFENQLVNSITDLYKLKKEDLINLPGVAETLSENLIKSIQKSKNQSFELVLFALGIRHIGKTIAKKLAIRFKSLEQLIKADKLTLLETQDIGEIIAETLINHFSDQENISQINELTSFGIKFKLDDKILANQSEKLKDLLFVVSGVFDNFSRSGIKQEIEKHSGKIVGSLSNKTSYLLIGSTPGPKKISKAEKLEIQLLSESNFIKMINDK